MSDTREKNSLESIRLTRMLLPIGIGLGAVAYLMYQNLDIDELEKIHWKSSVFFWLGMAILLYILRHICYSWRLKVMMGDQISWIKSAKLIVLWEFASAVSPSTVGGSGVALFFLSQERIKTAKVVSIILYSMVLDTFYFVLFIPLILVLLGPSIIRPEISSFMEMDAFGYTFVSVTLFMAVYGSFFFYGLFIRPHAIQKLLKTIGQISFFKKYKNRIESTADEIVVSAEELRGRNRRFFFDTILATIGAWTLRFLTINCIIMAFAQAYIPGFYDNLIMLGRGISMHIITSFSPTPGGAGIAEYLFGGFYTEYASAGLASLLALVWRVITYYSYLIAGAIIIPVWIAEILKKRKQGKVME